MKNDLLTIYGARVSKSGKHVNITLISGEGEQKQFYTTCVKLDANAKTQAKVKDGYVVVKINLLKDVKTDDNPF